MRRQPSTSSTPRGAGVEIPVGKKKAEARSPHPASARANMRHHDAVPDLYIGRCSGDQRKLGRQHGETPGAEAYDQNGTPLRQRFLDLLERSLERTCPCPPSVRHRHVGLPGGGDDRLEMLVAHQSFQNHHRSNMALANPALQA